MFKSIVVGTDGSDTATQAVRQAVDLAGAVGAKLELVSAYAPVSGAAPARGTPRGARGSAVGDQPARGRRLDARGRRSGRA